MVALSVFGREFGVQRQSLVVILLLLGCIVLEIVGQPFRYMEEAPWLLEKMEITALLVEFGTLWCGLMIYESGPESEGMNVVMTTCVVAANAGLMAWFLFVLFRAYAKQTKKLKKTFSRMVHNSFRMSFGRDQVSIHRRTFDANDCRNIDNPLDVDANDGRSMKIDNPLDVDANDSRNMKIDNPLDGIEMMKAYWGRRFAEGLRQLCCPCGLLSTVSF